MHIITTNQKGGVVSNHSLRDWLKNEYDVTFSMRKVKRIRRLIGMKAGKVRGSENLKESARVALQRFRHVKERFDDENGPLPSLLLYTDETFLNENDADDHSYGLDESAFLEAVLIEEENARAEGRESRVKNLAGLLDDKGQVFATRKTGKGPRAVIVAGLTELGFLEETLRTWRADIDTGDYHGYGVTSCTPCACLDFVLTGNFDMGRVWTGTSTASSISGTGTRSWSRPL